MTALFVFLLSSGFVGGVFKSVKKSIKSFLVVLCSCLVFFLLINFIAEISSRTNIFKEGFVEFVCDSFLSKIAVFNKTFSSKEDLIKYAEEASGNNIFKSLMLSVAEIYTPKETLSKTMAFYLYKILAFVFISILAFVLLAGIFKIIFSIFIPYKLATGELFVTSRFLSAFFGLAKGFVVFVFILNLIQIMLGLIGLHGVFDYQELVLNEGYYKNISAILFGYV